MVSFSGVLPIQSNSYLTLFICCWTSTADMQPLSPKEQSLAPCDIGKVEKSLMPHCWGKRGTQVEETGESHLQNFPWPFQVLIFVCLHYYIAMMLSYIHFSNLSQNFPLYQLIPPCLPPKRFFFITPPIMFLKSVRSL